MPKKTSISKSTEPNILRYLQEVHKFPILTPEEELDYSIRFAEKGDKEAAKILIQSHLRLVAKMAGRFKNYGLPLIDLISEGNLGLIHAVKKFDPHKGFRLSTYASWWIRAYIQDYILRSWSMVKIGTSLAQKKLFFSLHKIKRHLNELSGNISSEAALNQDQIKHIANDFNVREKDVIMMDSRLSQSDSSLNKVINEEEGDSKEMADFIASDQPNQEEIAIKDQEKRLQTSLFKKAFDTLNEREKDILMRRQMTEDSLTLEELSKIYNVSGERIRQIEENAIKKIKKEIANELEKLKKPACLPV